MVANAQIGKPMKSLEFFDRHPVFTRDEFVDARSADGTRSVHTVSNLLSWHVAWGRLLRVHRGLFASVPRGIDPESAIPDPYLVATKAAEDAVVAYHAALQYHGKAYSVSSQFTYVTLRRLRPFRFRGAEWIAVQMPAALRSRPDRGGGVVERRHAGGLVRVSSLERTMVDVLDAPRRGGGWEEIWRSLESVEFLDLDAVIEYALRLRSALTVARVGFYLEQHREQLMVEDHHLSALRKHAPAQVRYLDRGKRSGKLVRTWNLIVPEEVISRAWAAVS